MITKTEYPAVIKIYDRSYFKPKNKNIEIKPFDFDRDYAQVKLWAEDDAKKIGYNECLVFGGTDEQAREIIKAGYSFFENGKFVAVSLVTSVAGVYFIDGYNYYSGKDKVRWAMYGYCLSIKNILDRNILPCIYTPVKNKSTNNMAKFLRFIFKKSFQYLNSEFNLYQLEK